MFRPRPTVCWASPWSADGVRDHYALCCMLRNHFAKQSSSPSWVKAMENYGKWRGAVASDELGGEVGVSFGAGIERALAFFLRQRVRRSKRSVRSGSRAYR